MQTDVGQPGRPEVLNATCHDVSSASNSSIYLEWRRPVVYHKSVDAYRIFYTARSDGVFKNVSVKANPGADKEKVR